MKAAFSGLLLLGLLTQTAFGAPQFQNGGQNQGVGQGQILRGILNEALNQAVTPQQGQVIPQQGQVIPPQGLVVPQTGQAYPPQGQLIQGGTQQYQGQPGQYPPQYQPQQQQRQQFQIPQQIPKVLSNANLRDIDQMVVQLNGITKQLHDEFHHHLEGIRHAEKLDKDVTELEKMAAALHQVTANSNGDVNSAARLRSDTNNFIQHSVRIVRTIGLVEPWLPGNTRVGMNHMRTHANNALAIAHQIDRYLPVDTKVIDDQTAVLEAAIKELHDEFHEHMEGYEVSQHLDRDLEELESLVEHMHDLAHGKNWAQINLSHIMQDLTKVRQSTAHIESLFVQQARIGVRSRDWVGIEHSRDAITDVLSSAYLLEHMIRKTQPTAPRTIVNQPQRDRHGHIIQNPRPKRDQHLDLHNNGR